MEKSSLSDDLCHHQYLHCEEEILDNDSIEKVEFKVAVTKVLSDGWKNENNNIILVIPAYFDNTFILHLLTEIY